MKRNISILVLFGFLTIAVVGCQSQKSNLSKQEAMNHVSDIIGSANYKFIPSTVTPSNGMRTRQLDGTYSLKVGKDTITSYLPYFGRAYSAPYPSGDGGIKFVSTDFTYKVSEKKKGLTTVTIEIKDAPQSYRLKLTIGDTGYTTLFVQENNRQSISFYGIIE